MGDLIFGDQRLLFKIMRFGSKEMIRHARHAVVRNREDNLKIQLERLRAIDIEPQLAFCKSDSKMDGNLLAVSHR